jgi:hypothetical protein
VINSFKKNTYSIELEFTLKIPHRIILQSIKITEKRVENFSY